MKPLVGLQQAVLDGVLGLITHQPSRQRIQAGQLLAHQDAKTLLIRREAVHGFPKREAHQCHILKTPTTIVLLHCCTECPAPDRRRRGTVEQDRALAQGREAGQRLAWREAYTSLSLADQSSSLGEQISSYWQPRPTCSAMRTNAGRPYSAPIVPTSQPVMFGVPPGACSGWRSRFFSREISPCPVGGWQAGRLLDQEPRECAELGLLLLPSVVQASIEGDYTQAEAAATRAAEIGRRFGDADLFALGVHFQGRALLKLGRVREALALLDESMISVVTGEVWHPVAGNIYCSMIDACLEISDLRRADEWTTALMAWWANQPDLVTFTGQCLIHRAEIMQLHGAWPEAVEETRRACERLAHAADRYTTGAAIYRQAEIHRARGDLTAAENAFREATEWGHDAQPGLALLRLAQGETEAAAGAIRRVVTETTDRLRRAKLLPAHVEIMLAAGDISAAREAADELGEIVGVYDTPALRAAAGCALGGVLLAEDEARPALGALRRAWEQWRAPRYHTKPPMPAYSLASPAARSATRSPPRWSWMQPAESSRSSVPRRTFPGRAADLEAAARSRPWADPARCRCFAWLRPARPTMRSPPTWSLQIRPWIGT